VIIDDQALLTSALEVALEQEARAVVVGAAELIEHGIELVRTAAPDVVLTDRRLPDGDVEDHIAALRAACPASRLVMMTGWPTRRSSLMALEAGVHGIVSKAQPLHRIVDAIERVIAGELVVPASLAASLVGRARRSERGVPPGDLSARELDVLEALARGEQIAAIAHRLCISPNTARNHLARVMLKLGVHDRLAAVTEGIRLGLVSPHLPRDCDAEPAHGAVAVGR
jgi:DNA-binding NarL/FixJ family response regulator